MLKVFAGALAFALLGIGSVAAQTPPATPAPPAQPQAPWMKVCDTNAQGQQSCFTRAEIRGANGTLIASVQIQPLATAGQYGMLILLPLGVYLPPGIGVSVDTSQALTAEYSICLPNPAACVAEAPIAASFIDQLKAGTQLIFTATSPQRQAMTIPLSLSGFTTAFDGEGINQEQAEARLQELNAALQRSAEAARQRLIDQQNALNGLPPAAP